MMRPAADRRTQVARHGITVGSSIALSPIPSGLCVAILAWPEITCLDINWGAQDAATEQPT